MVKKMSVVLINLLFLVACSTTGPNLGVTNGALMACPNKPNCVSSQEETGKQFIQSIEYTGTQQLAFEKVLNILESYKRVKIVTAQDNYIRAKFASALFHFVDDVEFYFPEQQTGEKLIHVRSASRVGHSDLGENQKRVERIRSQFYQQDGLTI